MSDPDPAARLRPPASGFPAKLSDVAYAAIFGRIASGEYRVDSRLPTENALAADLSVSRPVVREALARLRDDGIVVSRRGSGTYVVRTPAQEVIRPSPLLSLGDMRHCLQFRISFEGEAAWHAAHHGGDRSGLTRAIERLESGLTAEVIGAEDDFLFHQAVAECTGNRFFITVMSDLRESIMSGMDITRSFGSLRARVHAQHLEIHEAILANDADAAKSAMRRHLESAMRRAFDGLDEQIHLRD